MEIGGFAGRAQDERVGEAVVAVQCLSTDLPCILAANLQANRVEGIFGVVNLQNVIASRDILQSERTVCSDNAGIQPSV